MELVPRLQRFYGGSPREWLTLPVSEIELFAKMLPRLKGEENIQAWQIAAAAAGTLEKNDRMFLIRTWRDQATPRSRRQRVSAEQGKIMLASIGIKVIECN